MSVSCEFFLCTWNTSLLCEKLLNIKHVVFQNVLIH